MDRINLIAVDRIILISFVVPPNSPDLISSFRVMITDTIIDADADTDTLMHRIDSVLIQIAPI